jgi:hypothetical protein
VGLDGLLANLQMERDHVVGIAGNGPLKHVALPRTQQFESALRANDVSPFVFIRRANRHDRFPPCIKTS